MASRRSVAEDAVEKARRSAAAHDREARRAVEQAAMQAAVAELRAEHPQLAIPESVKGGNSIDVRWTDGPTVDQVDAIALRYRGDQRGVKCPSRACRVLRLSSSVKPSSSRTG